MDLARVIQETHFSSYLSSPLGPETGVDLVISCAWSRARVPVDTQQHAHSCGAALAHTLLVPCPRLAGERAEGVHGTVLRAVSLPRAYAVCTFRPLGRSEIFYLDRWKASSIPPVLWAQVWGPAFL